jgi:chitinase
MRKKFKQGKWVMLVLALAVWCVGCSDHDSSTGPSNMLGDFHPTPDGEIQARITELKLLLPEETYNTITQKSRNNPECKEDNRAQLGLPDSPNGQWYYTYDNLIRGMAEWEEFANEGDENTRKLEIAAFLANIAQETGAGKPTDPTFGGPGCFIQEGHGGYHHSCAYGGCTTKHPMDPETCKKEPYKGTCPDGGVGWCGRGPHQLSWDYNYQAFGKGMGEGDLYLNNPDLLTQDPEIGIAGSIWFWGHADPGSSEDKPFKPSAHNVAVGKWKPTDDDKGCGRTKADFGVITNIINGGMECGPGAVNPQAAKNRLDYFKAIAAEMGLTIPDAFLDDCSTQKNFAKCVSYPDPTKRCGKDWNDADKNCRDCCNSNDDCPAEYPLCYGQLNPDPTGKKPCSCGK